MRNLPHTFEACQWSFFSAFSIFMTVSLSKAISITNVWKKLTFFKLRFSNLAPTYEYNIEFSNFLMELKNQRSERKNCVWLFHYFSFERSYDVLKSKCPCIMLNKNMNFIKNKLKSNMESPTHSFRKTTLQLI